MSENNDENGSRVIFHLFMCLITAGLWSIVLAVRILLIMLKKR